MEGKSEQNLAWTQVQIILGQIILNEYVNKAELDFHQTSVLVCC